MSKSKSLTKKRRSTLILERLKKQNPDPKCELVYKTPFQLLVSVALSAQATDKSVNNAMAPLYEKNLTPETILNLGLEGFYNRIKTIGLARTKAKNTLKLAEIIHTKYHDQIPSTREELEELPGVGRKTASVILAEIYHEPTLAVDTHVYRVTARLGLQAETNRDKAELELLKVIDKKFLPKAHHWFILLGRYTCKAARPECERCVLNDICPSSLVKGGKNESRPRK